MKFAKSSIIAVLSSVICFIAFGGILMSEAVAEVLFPYAIGAKEVSAEVFTTPLKESVLPDEKPQDKQPVVLRQSDGASEDKPKIADDTREFVATDNAPEGSLPIKSYTIKPADYLTGVDGVYIINEDNLVYSLPDLLQNPFSVAPEKNDEPQVLIVHTHATESYNEYYSNYYFKNEEYRSEDNTKNVVHIGKIIADSLEAEGIGVIHSEEQHDNPNYNKSYSNSNATIRKYLKEYPSIKLVLDVHRDTLISDSKTKYRPITEIDNDTVAQVMLLMGGGNKTYPNEIWKENLSFAVNLQKKAVELYPDLMRPILLRDSRYNQNLLAPSILVEVGTCGNTLREAELAALYFSDALLAILK